MANLTTIVSNSSVLPMLRKSAAPLRKQVGDELWQAILSGRLGPGTRLYLDCFG
jgi:DNA-binding GntR family transcriptional regulator